jgi:HAMP domain-containing protein
MAGASSSRDDEIARHLILRHDDLPGSGWTPHLIDLTDADDAGTIDISFEGFPEANVTASATSPRFTRGASVAWSIVWLLDEVEAAQQAFSRLADEAFATAFVTSAMSFDTEDSSAMMLGRDRVPTAPVGGLDLAVRHQTRLTAGDASGLVVVHLDLLALCGGRAACLIILGQSPEPVPSAEVERLARRVSDRLTMVS